LTALEQQSLAKSDEKSSYEARKVWESPHETIIKALEGVQLHETAFVSSSDSLSNKIKNETVTIEKSNAPSTPPQIDSKQSTINLIEDEQPPSVLSSSFVKTLNEALLFEITSGHFDVQNVTLLRTCSEPNLNKLFTIKEEEMEKSNRNKSQAKVKSLESILKSIEIKTKSESKSSLSTSSSSGDDLNDMSEVCLSLEQHLLDNTNDGDDDDENNSADDEDTDSPAQTIRKKRSPKKHVSLGSIKLNLLSNRSKIEETHEEDTLVDFGTNETASVTITLSDSGSDTEFEDEIFLGRNRFEQIEEKRVMLEKELGADTFIKVYKSIKVNIFTITIYLAIKRLNFLISYYI
jgi:hypothetical protein